MPADPVRRKLFLLTEFGFCFRLFYILYAAKTRYIGFRQKFKMTKHTEHFTENLTGRTKLRFLFTAVLIAADVLFMWLFHRYPSFFFPGYRSVSKLWIGFLAHISSIFPIAVWDIGAILLFLLFLCSFISVIRARKPFLPWLSAVLLIIACLVSEVILGWMLNHYAPPLADEIGLEVRPASVSELHEACEYYLQKAAEYAPLIERSEDGHLVRPQFYAIAGTAGMSYTRISETWPVFKGPSVPVKGLTAAGEYLMYNGIIGIFMPITGEAGVPYTVPSAPLPFTMAHEAAHRTGIASEEEANFAAFLACIHSDDIFFRYSGYYSAFSYCYSSLYAADAKLARSVVQNCETSTGALLVMLDRREAAEVYQSYESPLKDISDQVNDTYLKTFSQESGIRSYGEVTDDLLAWYRMQEEKNSF